MRKLLLALPFVFLASQASAGCNTAEDVQKKMLDFVTTAQKLEKASPEKAKKWAEVAQNKAKELMGGMKQGEFDKACNYYDEMIAEANKAM